MKAFDFETSDLAGKISDVKSKVGSLAFIRLAIFIGMGISFVLTFSQSLLWFFPLIAASALFVISVQRYNFLKDQEAIYLALTSILNNAEKRNSRTLQGIDPGAEFQDKNHPFANDLDLFGDHSLFQLVNHTVSKGAKVKLAENMKAPFDSQKAILFQEASAELGDHPTFLRAMESIGKAFYSDEKSNKNWQQWLDEKKPVSTFNTIFAFLGPLGGLSIIVFVALGIIPAAFLGLWILLGLIPLGLVFQPLKKASEKLPSRQQLKAFTTWLVVLEKMNFSSDFLKEKQSLILTESESASHLFHQLDRLGLWIDNRLNILYIPFNLLLWTDLFLYRKLQLWMNHHGHELSRIPEVLEDWEILVSLGSFEYELGSSGNITWTEDSILTAEAIAHPLLKPDTAIANDFSLGDQKRFILLTGANMSGKTTFMRTLGINCVMANMGLKPFAKNLLLGQFQLYTSMRNTDNLGESVSSFYAELSRIHQLIERLEKGEAIFFLLDEILKGTNTEDRIAGSEALVRQVAKTKALGIVSTHDIELSALEEKIDTVENRSFHSEILDNTINFDYKLKAGACPSFNAHKLMELMGIRFQDQ
ncbi:MutS-related protein [Algoriphagus pacificus]|uniref:DNA mismatch repair protein n=1 Tax=Algoriphagus pacificus TaxID=2811234 RepID=A0ABS3CAN0_9BACT|nr:DNA mismatch repair protein [Algoriphagus pacificus]MBN7814153.1 DNA mismatch repair protein [Algoriphagus pacificus]